ncbi:DMT family transporter [Kutzneria albida]|uniref:EamA domain-containing protein n=1 Tax=Kutzneria albida DSM 43870 TaxID=1449976 RepID=W5W2C2_9PSEU|nr:DMT family transporter [Kutzneria albida]AHH95017.1 hypothetical protein KALB_1645 [Kutzneria albida DSM 43870]
MHPTAAALLLLASVLHAAWNYAAKKVGSGGSAFVWLYYTLSAVFCVPLAIGYLLLVDVHPQWSWLPAAIGTAVLHVAYGVLLQRGYAVGDMSVVYPLARGTGPLLSVVAAVLVFHEHPGPLGLLGAGAVVLGVFVISMGRGARPSPASLGYGLLTGAAIAGYTLWDAHSVNVIGMPVLLYFTAGSVVQSMMLAPQAFAHRGFVGELWRTHRREVLVVALLSPIGYLLVLLVMRTTPVSVVAPARELSIVLGALVAWRVLGEPNPVRRLVGSVIVLAGIVGLCVG